MYKTCGHMTPPSSGSLVFPREVLLTMAWSAAPKAGACSQSKSEKAGTFSLWGWGHTRMACQAACLEQTDCHFMQFFSETGYCHMYQTCEDMAKGFHGSWVFPREILFAMARPHEPKAVNCGDESVKAGTFSLGGGGHTQAACQVACLEQQDCKFILFTEETGYCHMYQTCQEL